MEKINDFSLPRLHNGENVNFHHESLGLLDNSNPVMLGVRKQAVTYHSAYDELKLTIDVFSSSELSPELTRLENRRDRTYSALKAYVKVYLNDDDEEISEAAEHIIAVIRNEERELGNPLKIGSTKETTVLLSLLRNLAPLADDIDRIGAANRLKSLEDANQAYIDLQFERHIEKSTKHSGDVKAARAVTDAAYGEIVARINAQILLTDDEKFAPYVGALNTMIERYRIIVAQRRGRAEKKTKTK
jgi:hypothetical protein